MAIQPFIFIGVGGTGGKTLGVIRQTLQDALDRIGWDGDWPDGWQFVHIDVPADPDADTGANKYSLPRTSYVPLTTATSTYSRFDAGITQELQRSESDPTVRYLAWGCWKPEPASAVKVEIRNGAGQYRGLGRAVALSSLQAVDQRLSRAFADSNRPTAAGTLKEIQEQLGREQPGQSGKPRPVISVIGSVSGGSGSGMFLDVVDVLRAQGHREINAVLFTPEVFERPSGDPDPGIAPNTLLALSEISNSMWTHSEADAPLSRDRMFRRAGVGIPIGHGGPSTVFLVGRSNDAVTFDNADDVFRIVGRSLGELAMDEKLTTAVVNYDLANGNAVAAGSKDLLNLSVPESTRDVAPFRGLGFSRLTVGRDFFDRYATDRLSRLVGLRLLDGPLVERKADDTRSDEEIRKDTADENWEAFLRDARIDEVKGADLISDELMTLKTVEVERVVAQFREKVRSAVAAQTGGRKSRIINADARAAAARQIQIASDMTSDFGIAMQVETKRLAVQLQKTLQTTLEDLILHYVANHGLSVTLLLVDKLILRARNGVESLDEERRYVESRFTEGVKAFRNVPAGQPEDFPAGAVEEINRIVESATSFLGRQAQRFSKETAKPFLADLVDNLLGPWRDALRDADGLLRHELRPDVGQSPLTIWPDDKNIPDYLRPSKVEFMLDELEAFPQKFIDVMVRSVEGQEQGAAVESAVQEIIKGIKLGVRPTTRPVTMIHRAWVPREELLHDSRDTPSAARIELHFERKDIEGRTHEWLSDQEKFSGQYLKQSMGQYLDDQLVSAVERKQRQSRVVSQFEAMIKASLPLVSLDVSMIGLLHGEQQPAYNLHVSPLNIPDSLEDVRSGIREAAVALLGSEQSIDFVNKPRDDAMMMTLLKQPYHMMEISSIMGPISRQWARGGQPRDRWMYRRARPLSEWVPLGPGAQRALITGWFTARLLGEATVEGDGLTDLYVMVDGEKLQVPTAGVRLPDPRDHVGMLLEALPAAFLQCYDQKSLAGVRLYQHLIALGASLVKPINALSRWADGGGGPGGERVRQFVDSGVSRQDAALKQVDSWRSTYERLPEFFGDIAEAQNHPTYEVYDEAVVALDHVRTALERRPDTSLDF